MSQQSQNVCFGCLVPPDIKTCKDAGCFAYEHRNEALTLDHDRNTEVNLMVHRSKKEMYMV